MNILFAKVFNGRCVAEQQRPGLCQFAARADFACQQVCSRLTACLTRKAHVQHGFHPVEPRQFHRAAAEEHDYGVRVRLRHCLDHAVVAFGHFQVFTVKALGLVDIGKPCADYRDLRFVRGVDGLRHADRRHFALFIAAGYKGYAGHGIDKARELRGIDVAGT